MGENLDFKTKKIMNQIISKIKEEGLKRFETKIKFANSMNKSPGWLNNKLKGHRKMSIEDLILIAVTLNLNLEDLFPKNNNQINLEPIIECFQTISEDNLKAFRKLVGKVEYVLEIKNKNKERIPS